ncbi:MAG: bifunctional adenosylcobinamide kinase/adenosylcobinamide-phosphate guanylyltransferase [Leptolinea sp.]|nr:bifunctional adenosylcobinamide kinase/adenosylcobinamide-phosphate guanylyltransferase [Leptolinea sp.]
MTPKLTLVLGGARSGKSTFAQQLAGKSNGKVLYIATARILDDEMERRVALHRASRPPSWTTLELPEKITTGLTDIQGVYDVILLDCVTMLLNESFLSLPEDADEIEMTESSEVAIEDLISAIQLHSSPWILVSNEVGMGIVPETLMGRVFRDVQGRANQRLAAMADEVFFITAGIPMKIK